DDAAREPAERDHAGRHVADRDDAPGVAANLFAREVRPERDVVEGNARDRRRRALSKAAHHALAAGERALEVGDALLELLAALHQYAASCGRGRRRRTSLAAARQTLGMNQIMNTMKIASAARNATGYLNAIQIAA